MERGMKRTDNAIFGRHSDRVVVTIFGFPWNNPCDFVRQTTLALTKKARVGAFSPIFCPFWYQLIFNRNIRRDWLSVFKEKNITYFPSVCLLPLRRFRQIERLNMTFNLMLFKVLYRYQFERKPVFWITSYALKRRTRLFEKRGFVVYDRIDQPVFQDSRTDQSTSRDDDRRLLEGSDCVFVNSPYSLEYVRKYNKNSFLVPCGCALDLFEDERSAIPEELRGINRPIIGLTGRIDERLDFDILCDLARKRKDWSFVFVGSSWNWMDAEKVEKKYHVNDQIAELEGLSNTYFLGQKPKERVADFISAFDVCLIPYDLSLEFVKGCNPMKVYEYLAMGKPVVSTPVEAVKQHSPVVRIAGDGGGFEASIEAFLKSGSNESEISARKNIARENSWEEKVNRMWDIVTGLAGGESSPTLTVDDANGG